MQSKKYSLIESVTNTLIGFIVSLLIQLIIYPTMDIPVTFNQNIIITSVFTVVSILRGYVIRRIFNKIRLKLNNMKTVEKNKRRNCLLHKSIRKR